MTTCEIEPPPAKAAGVAVEAEEAPAEVEAGASDVREGDSGAAAEVTLGVELVEEFIFPEATAAASVACHEATITIIRLSGSNYDVHVLVLSSERTMCQLRDTRT